MSHGNDITDQSAALKQIANKKCQVKDFVKAIEVRNSV